MTDKNTAALAADHTEHHLEMAGRWYMLNKMGMATLCMSKKDAEQEAADAQMAWPHMGPHRAVQLVEASTAGFTAADMATASAQGFRDGVASISANAGEPSGHIKEPYTLAEIKAKIASNDYSAEMLLQHAMLLLDSASLAASAGEPVAWLVCTEEGDPDMVFLSQHEAQQYLEDDERPTPLYLHPSPQEGMVGGWQDIATAPAAGLILLAVEDSTGERRVFAAEASHENGGWVWNVTLGWLGWSRLHSGWTPILWRQLPPPPTTSAGS